MAREAGAWDPNRRLAHTASEPSDLSSRFRPDDRSGELVLAWTRDRLAEKLGFVEEARFRKARVVQGEEYDSLGFGVLREEWQARYPNGFGSQFR